MSRNREVYGCGCCGRKNTSACDNWCRDCAGHVAQDNRPPWDRTYEAITGKPCPFDLTQQVARENEAARASAEGVKTAAPNNGLPNNGLPNNGLPNNGLPNDEELANKKELPNSGNPAMKGENENG